VGWQTELLLAVGASGGGNFPSYGFVCMEEVQKPPKVFANQVIRQMIDHMFGEDLITEKNDFLVMRAAFRSLGGQWAQVSLGSLPQLEKLKQVVTTWGQAPERRKKTQEII
jgi:hypothetical protein